MKSIRVAMVPGKREVKLLENYPVQTSAGTLIIPAGFKTDFASVPRVFWNILPPWGRYSRAALIHDWLYRTPLRREVTRKEADRIFLQEMTEDDVAPWKRRLMYWAVRLFGAPSWREPECSSAG